MSERPQSGGEKHIDQIMDQLDPNSERFQVLQRAKHFKSSWVELGETLCLVRNKDLYRQWGYEDFDSYCSRELRIRRDTAQKLTLNFHFLESQEPELLARNEQLKPMPDYRSVDLLRQAKEEKGFSEEQYGELKKAIIEEERSHPAVLKQFKEVSNEISPPEQSPLLDIKAALSAARRLSTALRSVDSMEGAVIENIDDLTEDLEKRLDQINKSEDTPPFDTE